MTNRLLPEHLEREALHAATVRQLRAQLDEARDIIRTTEAEVRAEIVADLRRRAAETPAWQKPSTHELWCWAYHPGCALLMEANRIERGERA